VVSFFFLFLVRGLLMRHVIFIFLWRRVSGKFLTGSRLSDLRRYSPRFCDSSCLPCGLPIGSSTTLFLPNIRAPNVFFPPLQAALFSPDKGMQFLILVCVLECCFTTGPPKPISSLFFDCVPDAHTRSECGQSFPSIASLNCGLDSFFH